MTRRSVVIGLTGVVLICGVTFFNDRILRQTFLIGNNLPVAVYGPVLLWLVFITPLLRRTWLRGREWAVILTIVLAACCIPGSGLLRTFTSSLVQPHHFVRVQPGWNDMRIMDMLPDRMLADITTDETDVVDGFRQSLRNGAESIRISRVPWHAWRATLMFWLPIILALWLGMLGLSLVVHRQWSENEHLAYPIAAFTEALFPRDDASNRPTSRKRLFWVGLGAVLFVHLANYVHACFPEYTIGVARGIDLSPLTSFLPALARGGGTRLLQPTFYFCVIGVAFLIPKEISLSFGIGPYLWTTLSGILVGYGIVLDKSAGGLSAYMAPSPKQFLLLGANIGVFATILYAGRHRYRHVFAAAVGRPMREDVRPHELWGCRLFLAMMLLLVGQLVAAGINLPLAAAYVAGLCMLYVVMARLIAETGLFYIQPMVFPCVALWGLLGVGAIGLRSLLLLQFVSTILFIDPRESLMPFLMNGWKMLEIRHARLGRTAVWCAVAIAVGLAVALPITLYLQYDHGSNAFNPWADEWVPKFAFDNAVSVKQTLIAQGQDPAAVPTGVLGRWADVRTSADCVWPLLAGLVCVALFAVARLRLPWWPLHPLLFVTWATEPLMRLGPSFLLGWIIHAAVMQYGGIKRYNTLKPLMMGLIAGEILGAAIPSLINAVIYGLTGNPAQPFQVLPG